MAFLNTHRRAILMMVCAATLWSIAGVLTRHLDAARGFEVTFWRSFFSALFVAAVLVWQQGVPQAMRTVRSGGRLGVLSGMMWCVMFCCFMIALTKTTVANTLVVMSVSPLLTAFLAWLILKQAIPARTWGAIVAATIGIAWMFVHGMSGVGERHLLGMLIAAAVPVAAAINLIAIKKAGHGVDLVPAVLLGSIFSAGLMLPLAWPVQASWHDVAILAVLGFFQLGLPCMMMVKATKALSAPEVSLLALLEVLLGPIWAWLGAGEVPAQATLIGGAIVMGALVFNELSAMRSTVRGGGVKSSV
ncbi:DMT family transporter [Noviherbaspirillum cavernae]|uniref:DMT family transporter n=1 Tax=Noviherbaspirillum cavernae TaxID=2320862 RepID=A0A418X6E4_9BURK|nr:DMT family transporter [Noviherbaspirillum cavernae]RJG08038.1 DMT family transporter [Noviherbaspirillum cavernae]